MDPARPLSGLRRLDGLRWRRRLRYAVLLPVAIILVLLEGIIWRSANALLRQLAHAPLLEVTRQALSHLSGWAALPMFLVPEAVARVGELWTAVLLYRGHVASAVLVYALVRVVATLVAVFIWQACREALLRLAWFARMVGWGALARYWALDHTAPLRAMARRLAARQGGALQRLMRALRQRWQLRH